MGLALKINQVFFILQTRKLSVNRKDLQASTLVGLTGENPTLDPLAVLHLDNRPFTCVNSRMIGVYEPNKDVSKKEQNRL